jgi:4a-hydroxytetrahydrobiopterin dehydratase
MSPLEQATCETCATDGKPLTTAECAALLQQLAGWRIESENNVAQLCKTYLFTDFDQALAFTNQIGGLAKQHDHHPALLTEWGKVTVRWWTHSVSGLHRNDFILAARTDVLSRQPAQWNSD